MHDRRYIVRIGNKWRAQVGHTEDGVQRKYYSCYVEDPRVAAKDADKWVMLLCRRGCCLDRPVLCSPCGPRFIV